MTTPQMSNDNRNMYFLCLTSAQYHLMTLYASLADTSHLHSTAMATVGNVAQKSAQKQLIRKGHGSRHAAYTCIYTCAHANVNIYVSSVNITH